MRGWTFVLLAALLSGCTGENVDEDFLSTHGAILARVSCDKGVFEYQTSGSGSFIYEATMFLDGSVLAWVNLDHGGQSFYERSDSERVHARINVAPFSNDCSGPSTFLQIDNGDLTKTSCTGPSPSTYQVTFSMDIDTDCSGHNKHLFD